MNKIDMAITLLEKILARPIPMSEVEDQMIKAGVSLRTYQRAKQRLGVRSEIYLSIGGIDANGDDCAKEIHNNYEVDTLGGTSANGDNCARLTRARMIDAYMRSGISREDAEKLANKS